MEQIFIPTWEMYMGSCYFFAGTLLLWQQIQSARDPAVGDERRAGAVIWAQQGQPPSSTPSRSQGAPQHPGLSAADGVGQQQCSAGLAAITAAGSTPAQGQGCAIRQVSSKQRRAPPEAAHQPAPDGRRPQHGGGASADLVVDGLHIGLPQHFV